jgi:phosphopantetheinyl transferase
MRLQAGALHIWRADLDSAAGQTERLLDERELERAGRIAREPVRRRWMAARGVLRTLLGQYLDEDPMALRFALGPHGKPALDCASASGLHFSLSHSGGLAVYGLSETCAVGIDVELVSRRPRARAYSRDFLRAWVRHEAETKRLGAGGGGGPNRTHPADSNSWIGELPRGGDDPDRTGSAASHPWIAELQLGRGAVGAVALATTPLDFQVYPVNFRSCGSILPVGQTTPGGHESNVSKYWFQQEIQHQRGNAR